MNAAAGELWELIPYYRQLWNTQLSCILVKRVALTDVWVGLCVETSELLNITISSSLYQRVV